MYGYTNLYICKAILVKGIQICTTLLTTSYNVYILTTSLVYKFVHAIFYSIIILLGIYYGSDSVYIEYICKKKYF